MNMQLEDKGPTVEMVVVVMMNRQKETSCVSSHKCTKQDLTTDCFVTLGLNEEKLNFKTDPSAECSIITQPSETKRLVIAHC